MRLERVEPEFLDRLKFNRDGLLPAIVQDVATRQVLMLAYMNRESLAHTLESGDTWFYSRSRQELWHKGETSGHFQRVEEAYLDCDSDTLLLLVRQDGVACHEGYFSCFHQRLTPGGQVRTVGRRAGEALVGTPAGTPGEESGPKVGVVLEDLFRVLEERKREMPEGSYTAALFQAGLDKILKKVGEEAAEVLLAAKGGDREQVIYELADLFYHCLVLLSQQGLALADLARELERRR